MINGSQNPLNGDLGHLRPALVEGKGIREVALSAEGKRELPPSISPQLAERIYLEA